ARAACAPGRPRSGARRRSWCLDAGLLEQPGDGVARSGALGDPLAGLLDVERHAVGLLLGPIGADRLDEATITRRVLVGHHDPVHRQLLAPFAAQANPYCHLFALLERLRTRSEGQAAHRETL